MRAMIIKEFRELRRDRRTLALLIAMPLLLLVIFGYAANFQVDHLTTRVYGADASTVTSEIAKHAQLRDHLTIDSVNRAGGVADAKRALRNGDASVAIVATGLASGQSIRVYIDGSNLFAAQSAKLVFSRMQQALAATAQQTAVTRLEAAAKQAGAALTAAKAAIAAAVQSGDLTALRELAASGSSSGTTTTATATPPSITTTVLFNPDLKTAWVMVPAIIGLILTFIGTVITSIGLVRERESGTLEQLAVMPLHPSSVVLGKIAPYFLLASLDMTIITTLGMLLFGVPFNGPWPLFVVGAALFLFVVLGLGVLISSVSQTTGQAIQLAFMVLLPQILLSGMIFPLDAMAAGVRWIGYLLPLTWFVKVSQGVLVRGASWDALWFPLLILAIMAVVIFGLATLRLGRSIAPARPRRRAEPAA